MSKRPQPKEQAVVATSRATIARAHPGSQAKRMLIGWSLKVDLPEWEIYGLRAKADSGARTSALHVASIRVVSPRTVQFEVILRARRGHQTQKSTLVKASIRRHVQVRSSTGQTELRYIVATLLRIGQITKRVEISLASRDSMRYRMLLGRSALGKDFLIDVSRAGINLGI